MYKLIIEDDEGKTTVVPLIRDEISIGRKDGNTIRLTERNVSRKHARLLKSNGAVFIEDLQSFNGIKVNGDRIAGRAPIAEGDRIQIGDYQLALKLDKSAATDEPRAEAQTTPFIKEEVHKTAAMEAPTRMQPVIQGGAPAPDAQERPARLVVVSSNFAGKEWKLEKAQMVIGRTDENDIVVNHRSISRNHAKIVREQGRYQVVDLGSANGVRVNGEEYGKVELRKGDVIDLGHVRMRFVAPNEDFVFARDAQVVDVDTGAGKKGKAPIYIGVGAAVVLFGIVGFVVLRGPGKTDSAQGGSGANKGRMDEVIADADRAIKALDWATAMGKADEGLKLDASNEVLREKKAKAEAELKNQVVYEQYIKATKGNDSETAVMRYQELPDNSAYHEKAQDSWSLVKKDYIASHLGKARGFQSAGKCDDAKKHVEAVLLVDEVNTDAQDIARRCGQVTPPPRTPKTPRAPHDVSPRPVVAQRPDKPPVAPVDPITPPAPPKPPVGPNVDAAVGEAQDDYVHGNYSSAIEKARKALKSDPGNSKAWRIIGASSCFLRDKNGASASWNKLGAMDRQFLKYVCQRNQITIP